MTLVAHLEERIVYHEATISRYDLMRERLIESQLANASAIARLAANIANEEAVLARLHATRLAGT